MNIWLQIIAFIEQPLIPSSFPVYNWIWPIHLIAGYKGDAAMKRRKPLHIVLIVLASLLGLYLIPCFYISCQLNGMVHQSYDTRGKNNPYPERLSARSYQALCCRYYHEEVSPDQETYRQSFPLTILWPGGGKSIYWYSHEVLDANSSVSSGSWNIDVTVTHQFQNGKWRISDVFDPV